MADSGLIFGITVLIFAIITARLLYGNTPSEAGFKGVVNEKATEEWVNKIAKGDLAFKIVITIGVIATVLVAAFATHFYTGYAINPQAVALTAVIPIGLLLFAAAYYSQTPMTVDGQVIENYEAVPVTEEKK